MEKSEEKKSKACCKFGLRPLNLNNVLYFYAPIQGVISYTALSVNVMNPSLVVRVFPKRDVTNILLVNTLLGSGLYIYNRPHLKSLSKGEKIMYSAFGATTFSLGSILIWALVRNFVPENIPLCTICGIGSGFALLKVARNYIKHIDSLVKKQ